MFFSPLSHHAHKTVFFCLNYTFSQNEESQLMLHTTHPFTPLRYTAAQQRDVEIKSICPRYRVTRSRALIYNQVHGAKIQEQQQRYASRLIWIYHKFLRKKKLYYLRYSQPSQHDQKFTVSQKTNLKRELSYKFI